MNRVLTWVFIVPCIATTTITMATASLIMSLFDRTGNAQHRMARMWARILLWVSFVRVTATGVEKLDPAASYVLVSNHSSYFDTPVIIASIPLQFRFFAKKGLFQIPFLGTHLQRAGHFPVVRDDPRASLKSMLDGARQIRDKKISVLLFPEGGRSLVTLREFKEGAAHIAIKAGVPIVPVGITGARRVLPMHGTVITPGRVHLSIGEPIATAGLASREREALTRTVMERVAEMIGEPVPGIEACGSVSS